MVRALINWQVTDLLEETTTRLRQNKIQGVEDVRSFSGYWSSWSGGAVAQGGLEAFLHERVYRHHRVMRMAVKGARIVRLLFDEFCRAPELLPARYARKAEQPTPAHGMRLSRGHDRPLRSGRVSQAFPALHPPIRWDVDARGSFSTTKHTNHTNNESSVILSYSCHSRDSWFPSGGSSCTYGSCEAAFSLC